MLFASFRSMAGMEPEITEERPGVIEISAINHNRPILVMTGLGLVLIFGWILAGHVVEERHLDCRTTDEGPVCTHERTEFSLLDNRFGTETESFSADEIGQTAFSHREWMVREEMDAEPTFARTELPETHIELFDDTPALRREFEAFLDDPEDATVAISQDWRDRTSSLAGAIGGIVLGIAFFGFATAGYRVRVSARSGTVEFRRTRFVVPKTSRYDLEDVAGVDIEENRPDHYQPDGSSLDVGTTYRPVLWLRDGSMVPITLSYDAHREPSEKIRDRIEDILDASSE